MTEPTMTDQTIPSASADQQPALQPATGDSPVRGSISEDEVATALLCAREQVSQYDGRPLANAVCEKIAFTLRQRLPALASASSLHDFEMVVIDACARDIAKLVEADFTDAAEDILWEVEDTLEVTC